VSSAFRLIAILMFALAIPGCATQPPPVSPSSSVPTRPLPFKGRLREGNPQDLPPAVAISLDPNSPISFSYREELTHEDQHRSMMVAGFDPRSYFGHPIGEYAVTASAMLAIYDGDRLIAVFAAQARAQQSYTMYSQPTHREVEDQARAEVRDQIDLKLYRDYARLARSLTGSE
jgi:hypothetical protein